jgi:hypothetical protein
MCTHLVVSALLADLLEALLDLDQAGGGGDGVDQQEGVGRGDREPSHRRELHVTRRVEDVDLGRRGGGQTFNCENSQLFQSEAERSRPLITFSVTDPKSYSRLCRSSTVGRYLSQ